MATIDKLDLSVYNMYALRTLMIEQINQQIHLTEAASIPPQTYLVDNLPKISELDLLLGIIPLNTPWAYFFPPKEFRGIRRSPFSFSKIAPSLSKDAKIDVLMKIVATTSCTDKDEEEEQQALLRILEMIKKLDKWLGEIIGKVGMFLQG